MITAVGEMTLEFSNDPEYFLVSLGGSAERAYTERQRLVMALNTDLDVLAIRLQDLTFKVSWADKQMTYFADILDA